MFLSSDIVTAVYVLYSAFSLSEPHHAIIRQKNAPSMHSAADKKVVVNDLAEKFGVTKMTIRRDLSFFEKQGIVKTSYGGAYLTSGAQRGTQFSSSNPYRWLMIST